LRGARKPGVLAALVKHHANPLLLAKGLELADELDLNAGQCGHALGVGAKCVAMLLRKPRVVEETALVIELRAQGLAFDRQLAVPVRYRGTEVGLHRLDLLVARESRKLALPPVEIEIPSGSLAKEGQSVSSSATR
jgi:hypothetical protein